MHKFNCSIGLALILALSCGTAEAKGKRGEILRLPQYDVHHSSQLPRDVQISAFLTKGETKVFYYWSDTDIPISVTVTPCISPIRWSVRHRANNDTKADNGELNLGEYLSRELRTVPIPPSRGLYTVHLEALDRDCYVHVYVSTEPDGPQALQVTQLPKLRLQKRQRRKRLTVKWSQSLVDPHVTEYCLVVSTKRNYSTLCEAMEEKFGVHPPNSKSFDVAMPKTKSGLVTAWGEDMRKDPTINCVGTQTYFTLSDLEHGKLYYFNLFATNRQSNLSYPFGSIKHRFDSNVKPIALKDGKAHFANLRKLDGKAVFRFKVAQSSTESLKFYIMPCGGAVDVEVLLKGKQVVQRKRVDGYDKLTIEKPKNGQRYNIRVLTSNREELKRTSGVEVLATTKPSVKFPLPNMPSEVQVYEYISLRNCDSVTVGWLPSPDQRAFHYCLVVREGRIRELEGYRMPNQCGLENRLKKSVDFAVKYCQDIKKADNKVITQKVSQLKPGRHYVVQVTVKKPRGKTLSYDLLQVHTKPSCDHRSNVL